MSDDAAPHETADPHDPGAKYRSLPEPVPPVGTTASLGTDPDADQDAEYHEVTVLLRNIGG
jgi:hypothetical protein